MSSVYKGIVVLTALMLLFSGTGCLMACTSEPPHDAVPLCHQHSGTPACEHPQTIAVMGHSVAKICAPEIVASSVSPVSCLLPRLAVSLPSILRASSLPDPPALHFTILRI